MENNYLEVIKDFIKEFDHYDELMITENILMTRDLSMNGDDAARFLYEFAKKFNIDTSEFDFCTHFLSESEIVDYTIIKFFFGKRKGAKRKDLSVGELIQAMKTGKLI